MPNKRLFEAVRSLVPTEGGQDAKRGGQDAKVHECRRRTVVSVSSFWASIGPRRGESGCQANGDSGCELAR
jgi:hypothetical protein